MSKTAVQTVAEIRVEAGRTTILDLKTEGQAQMDVSGSLEIMLIDKNGNPFTNGPVYLTSESGDRSYTIQIDEQGRGLLEGIVPGTYILSLQPTAVPSPVAGGAVTGSYEIHLKNSRGDPVEAPVYLISDDWDNIYEIKIDSNGYGVREGLIAGQYSVSLQKKIILDQKIYFHQNKNGLDQAAGETLNAVERYISDRSTENVASILCVGYASDEGSNMLNDNLSIARGVTVREALKEKFKSIDAIIGMKVTSVGRGEIALSAEARKSDDAQLKKQERKQNRRVEIEILFK